MSSYSNQVGYVPDYLRGSKVIKAILAADGSELDQVDSNIEDMLLQFYVETATENGLTLWENFVGLSSYAGKPLAQRRSAILAKLRGVGTVTTTLIKSVVESFDCGKVEVLDRSTIYTFDAYRETSIGDYTIEIRFTDTMGIPPNMDDVKAAIEEIKPAHLAIVYVFNYLTWDVFDAQSLTWDALDAKKLTWANFETGEWI